MTFKEIFDDLYSKIRLMPTGEYSINKLSKLSGHHFNSIKDYISIMDELQKDYFRINLIMKDDRFFVEIQNNLLERIEISKDNEFLIKFYLFEAFNAESSVQLKIPNTVKSDLLKNEFIKKNNLKFFLTKKGITETLYLLQTIDDTDFESILENENAADINTPELVLEYQIFEAESNFNTLYSSFT